jgi:hypothetical protein
MTTHAVAVPVNRGGGTAVFSSERTYIPPLVSAEFVDSIRANELERSQQQSREVIVEEVGEDPVGLPTVTAYSYM